MEALCNIREQHYGQLRSINRKIDAALFMHDWNKPIPEHIANWENERADIWNKIIATYKNSELPAFLSKTGSQFRYKVNK